MKLIAKAITVIVLCSATYFAGALHVAVENYNDNPGVRENPELKIDNDLEGLKRYIHKVTA